MTSLESYMDVGAWMLLYLLVIVVCLYVVSAVVLFVSCKIPSVPLRRHGKELQYKDEKLWEGDFCDFTVVVVGGWSLVALGAGGVVLLLGFVGMLLGVPIPE